MATETIEKDPKTVQMKFYSGRSGLYSRNKSDSPDSSRISLLRRAHPFMSALREGESALELGSGRQIVARQYLRDRSSRPPFILVTLDIADISRKQLLVKGTYRVTHARADGECLPFQDSSVSLVISSMALDFMGEGAIPEVYRVLKPGGRAEINLHHPNLIPENLDQLLQRRKVSKTERTVLEYWSFLQSNNILTRDPNVLKERFIKNGFSIDRLVETKDFQDTWWEVSISKPTNNTQCSSKILYEIR